MRRRVAEVAVWLCEGRRKAKGLRWGEAMAGLGSSLVDTGLATLILSARAYADGWRGWFTSVELGVKGWTE